VSAGTSDAAYTERVQRIQQYHFALILKQVSFIVLLSVFWAHGKVVQHLQQKSYVPILTETTESKEAYLQFILQSTSHKALQPDALIKQKECTFRKVKINNMTTYKNIMTDQTLKYFNNSYLTLSFFLLRSRRNTKT
jgi:hypothetical protein